MKTLKQLIAEHDWYYINPDITEENFPKPKTLRKGKVTIFHPTLKDEIWTSESALKEMKEKGLTPLNLYELLEWKKKGLMEKGNWYAAFGETVKIDGSLRVPCVRARTDGVFLFLLGYFEFDWYSDNCVAVFCDDEHLNPQALNKELSSFNPSDIEARLKAIEDTLKLHSLYLF